MWWRPVLSVLALLAVILLVLAGAYLFTRWAGRGLVLSTGGGGRGRLQAVERLSLGRDQSLVVVRTGTRFLLLGCTPAGISLLRELTPEEGEGWSTPQTSGAPPDFLSLIQRLRGRNDTQPRS
ncbi:MAG: flagellar biosynthetic protein FliO [Lawsonibacter sp.]|nr:flagellar biosynthetic protein FliO [Lawsonibacter sp.]